MGGIGIYWDGNDPCIYFIVRLCNLIGLETSEAYKPNITNP